MNCDLIYNPDLVSFLCTSSLSLMALTNCFDGFTPAVLSKHYTYVLISRELNSTNKYKSHPNKSIMTKDTRV